MNLKRILKNIDVFVNEIDGENITLMIDIHGSMFIEPGFMEDEPMNPETKKSFYSVERQLNEMEDKEIIERSLEYLRDLLNEEETAIPVDYSKKENQIGCGYCAHEEVCKIKTPKVNKARVCKYWVHWKDVTKPDTYE